MHTFFINASSRKLNEYKVLFDIHVENKTFVSMDCPMSKWFDKKEGYSACIRQMSDMIEGNVELNNAFNLIIYIDLPENSVYSSLKRDAFHDVERKECEAAMNILYTHLVYKTIVSELTDTGRTPQSVLLMFGEEKEYLNSVNEKKNPLREAILERTLSFLGLPPFEEIEEIAKGIDAGDEKDKGKAFAEKIFSVCRGELFPEIRDLYLDTLDLWCNKLMADGEVGEANSFLFAEIEKINEVESGRLGIEHISCRYDSFACSVNRSVCALNSLNIAMHLLKCIDAKSIYVPGTEFEGARELMEFHPYLQDEIVPILKSKNSVYKTVVDEIDGLKKLYTKLNLAPPLRVFDHDKFGLDEFGDLDVRLEIEDTVKAKKGEDTDETSEKQDEKVIRTDERQVVIRPKERKLLFLKDEYAPMDTYAREKREKLLEKNPTPAQYEEYAKKLRLHHLKYLKEVKRHVTEKLSNYAGKSKDNNPALLQMGGARYARSDMAETFSLETSADLANQSYQTMFEMYEEFCAARSVAITDIQEQCDWFVTKIAQITRSLQLLKRVALGVGIGIAAVYLPYIIIQFEAIFKNIVTIAVALGSLGLPVVILYTVFGVLAANQRKRYSEVCEEFERRSDEIIKENSEAVEKFDHLLAGIIPGLRWVYEYKLDVKYCTECCEIADAKVEHHRKKLRDRIVAIANILRDLEEKAVDSEGGIPGFNLLEEIDFNVPYCAGEKNCKLYSVIEQSVLDQREE